MKRTLAIITILTAAMFGLPSNAKADDFVAIDYADHNLYQTGKTEVIKESIKGDFYCLAEKCVVDKPIEGDVIGAAYNFEINAFVMGDVRVAAREIVFGDQAVVTRNATIAAANITIEKGAVLKQDLLVAGSDLDLNLTLGRDLLAGAENLKIFGKVDGEVKADAGRIYVDKEAVIKGDAYLEAKKFDLDKSSFKADLKQKKIKRTKSSVQNSFRFDFKPWAFAAKTISAILVILLINYVVKKRKIKLPKKHDFVKDSALGFGVLIVLPIAALLVLLVSARLSFIIFGLWLALISLAPIVGVYLLANQAQLKYKYKTSQVLNIVLAAVAYNLLVLVPLLGGLITLFCFGFGSGYLIKQTWSKK